MENQSDFRINAKDCRKSERRVPFTEAPDRLEVLNFLLVFCVPVVAERPIGAKIIRFGTYSFCGGLMACSCSAAHTLIVAAAVYRAIKTSPNRLEAEFLFDALMCVCHVCQIIRTLAT